VDEAIRVRVDWGYAANAVGFARQRLAPASHADHILMDVEVLS
jgi:hypothetical protein